MISLRPLLGLADVVLVTLDTLRYDVAAAELAAGRTPGFAALLPSGWEERHTPASFTLPAHLAFFHGFLPTPPTGPAERLLAVRFEGSETIGPRTVVFETPDVVSGLAAAGYRTVCIGGTGFFNPVHPLGRVLPALFEEAHWREDLSVTEPHSTRHQVDLALEVLGRVPPGRLFLFVNVSAIHQPNRGYLQGRATDDLDTHAAALRYVDRELARLWDALRARGRAAVIVCSDHGTCYGEDGLVGHRVGHPAVWTVPYAELLL